MQRYFMVEYMSEKKFESPFPDIAVESKKMTALSVFFKAWVWALAIIGGLFVLVVLAVLSTMRQDIYSSFEMPGKAVLVIDGDAAYPEMNNGDLWAELSGEKGIAFADLISAVNKAADDERVQALVLTISSPQMGLAQIQELRDAVKDFRKKGKVAYVYSNGFGSVGGGTAAYYLATAGDKIVMMPNTEIGATGVALEVPFFKKLLDKIGVKPEFYTRYEYKTAMASLTEGKFSKPFKEEMRKIGQSVFDDIVKGIADERKMSAQKVIKMVNQAPLSAEEGLKEGWIDEIEYLKDFEEMLKARYAAESVDVKDYATLQDGAKAKGKIAVLTLEGMITEESGGASSWDGEVAINAQNVRDELDSIAADTEVKALVLRINSPGGSYVASHEIWHELESFKADTKLSVVVSMGNYAASGGYFLAIAGDRIFAEPLTITGSVGVLGGKFVLKDLWRKLDVNWESLQWGDNASLLSSNTGFNKSEKAAFEKSLDRIYRDFTAKVIKARSLDLKKADSLFRGRVWLGSQAVENGLADEIGGLDKAIQYAKNESGLKDENLMTVYYPQPLSWQQQFEQLLGGSANISVNKVAKGLGLDDESIKILCSLKYETVLLPFTIRY